MGFFEKTIGRGNFWTFLIGLGLSIWGALALADIRYWTGDRVSGSPWLLLPGGIMLLIAFSNIYMYRYNRERILGTLKSYQRISINQIATELRMKEKDVKDMIIDLRTEGKLKASFDPESGDAIVFEVKGQPPIGSPEITETKVISTNETYTPTMKNIKAQGYCPYCGSLIKPDDRFCNNCGAAIE